MPEPIQQTVTSQQADRITRILRLPELRQRIGLGSTAIYERLNPNSKYFDPTFPQPISLGGGRYRAIGFIEAEVERWLRSQIERRSSAPVRDLAHASQ